MTTAKSHSTTTSEVTVVFPEITPPLTRAAAADSLALLLEKREGSVSTHMDAQEAA